MPDPSPSTVEPGSYANAVGTLRGLLPTFMDNADAEASVKAQEVVLTRYGPVFSSERIDALVEFPQFHGGGVCADAAGAVAAGGGRVVAGWSRVAVDMSPSPGVHWETWTEPYPAYAIEARSPMRHVALVLMCVLLSSVVGCSSSDESPPTEPTADMAAEPTAPPAPATEAAPEVTEVPEWYISRDVMGDDWPFTVDDGSVACEGGAVTFTSGDVTYAVNGTAKSQEAGADVMAIWADDPAVPGLKIDISEVINRGLALCP